MPAAPTQPTAKRSRRGRLSEGAPTKKTPEMLSRISEAISLGLTDEETCNFVGIETDTLVRWKKDPEFYGAMKRRDRHQTCSAAEKIEMGADGWHRGSLGDGEIDAAALFEVRISDSLSNSFNQSVSALSITISAQEATEIEARAAPNREKVRSMLEEYQLRRSNGDQNANGSISMSVQEKFARYRPASGNG